MFMYQIITEHIVYVFLLVNKISKKRMCAFDQPKLKKLEMTLFLPCSKCN